MRAAQLANMNPVSCSQGPGVAGRRSLHDKQLDRSGVDRATGRVSGSGSTGGGNWLQRIAANHTLKLVAGGIAVVAGLATIATFVLDLGDRIPDHTPSGKASPAVTSAASSPTGNSPKRSPARAATSVAEASGCLTSNYQPVDCREQHRYELLSQNCSTSALLDYMGGRAGLDVALVHPVTWNDGQCLLDAGRDISSSAKDVLAADVGDDGWRRCYDARRNRIIPCDEPHSGEYVATGAKGKASQAECEEAAGTYMERSIAANADLLRVHVIANTDDDQNSPRCLISVRGTQRLAGSLRRLAVNTVPIAS
jgi:hypothetical protein